MDVERAGRARWLVTAAAVPMKDTDAIYAQWPKLTLPATDAGVAEGASLTEFAASTAGSVTLSRHGRFTDLTEESLVGADAGTITAVHRTAVARDLDAMLIGAVDTDAGAAVGSRPT